LTCISSWYICIPNIIWIHILTITEKMNGNCHYQECDGRRTGRTSPYHNTSRFQRAYKIWDSPFYLVGYVNACITYI
jgi:hypothetical protein